MNVLLFFGRPPFTRIIAISLDEADRSIVDLYCFKRGAKGGTHLNGFYHIDDRLRRGTCGRFPTWLGLVLVRDASTEDPTPGF